MIHITNLLVTAKPERGVAKDWEAKGNEEEMKLRAKCGVQWGGKRGGECHSL
jgi:hypothetical protein